MQLCDWNIIWIQFLCLLIQGDGLPCVGDPFFSFGFAFCVVAKDPLSSPNPVSLDVSVGQVDVDRRVVFHGLVISHALESLSCLRAMIVNGIITISHHIFVGVQTYFFMIFMILYLYDSLCSKVPGMMSKPRSLVCHVVQRPCPRHWPLQNNHYLYPGPWHSAPSPFEDTRPHRVVMLSRAMGNAMNFGFCGDILRTKILSP